MLRQFTIIKISLILFCGLSFSQDELAPDKIFEKADNSVVVILAYDKEGNLYQGSGVVLDNDGTIVTNHHVCKDASRIDIKHYNKEFKNAVVTKFDEVKDIMLLKITDKSLPPVSLGNSGSLKSGQRLYSIGSPEGYENSISEGIISGFRIDENGVRLIQMTAPITEGSSGGAVLNSKGELIGLSVSGQHEGNLYFAIPINDVYSMLDKSIIHNITENEDPANYYRIGEQAKENEDYKGAEKYFSKYLEKFSNDAGALFARGYARFKLKEYKNAISDFSEVVNAGGSTESYFYRGNCYYSIKDYKNAHADYTKALEYEPDNSDVLFNRGYAGFKMKQYSDALNDWGRALELNKEYQNALSPVIKIAKEELAKQK